MTHKKHTDYIPAILLAAVILGVLLYFAFRTTGIVPANQTATASMATDTPIVIDEDLPQELLGKASLSFAGGTDGRAKNIELGVARIDGTIIRPGEEFSFAKELGAVTADDGFSEEKIFLNGEVAKGLGGGLCQVSTVLFQSVINSALPVTERHNHTYTVSYYDLGLDATFADPGPNLRFVNDTAHAITIKGKTENNTLLFEIYGVKDGRIASTSEAVISKIVDFPSTKYITVAEMPKDHPECFNAPQIGYTSKITYDIIYASGETKEQVFASTYRPLQRVCYVLEGKI